MARAGARRRPGFALIMVLGFVAVAVILSLAFASRTCVATVEAANHGSMARASSLAASGVSMAARYLMYPPASVTAGSYWTGTGGAGVSIDGTSDYCTISVTGSTTDLRQFSITSVGTAVDAKGVVRGKRTVTASVLLPPPNQWYVPCVCLAGASQSFPGRLEMNGNVHANGSISSVGRCTGAVTATGTASWPSGSTYGPPTSVSSNQAWRRIPAIVPNDWSSYQINGTTYTASTYGSTDLLSVSWPNNGVVVTGTNPGGVLVATATSSGVKVLRLRNSVNFTGTLVVDGDLQLDGTGVQITAVSGYPAIVVSRDLVINSTGMSMTVTGAVLVEGVVRKGNKSATIQINGPLITNGSIDDAPSGAWLEIDSFSSRSTFFNPGGQKDTQPYSVLRWIES